MEVIRKQEGGPIATDVAQQFRTLDPITRELYFGSGVPGTESYRPGFIQQAFRAAERTFYDDQGRPIVVPEQVAGLSPDQLRAMQMSREAIGMQTPYLQQAQQAYGTGLESLFGGTDVARGLGREALGAIGAGVGEERGFRERGLESLFGGLGEAAGLARGAESEYGRGLAEAGGYLRAAGMGQYDPRMARQFYDPYQEDVIAQTRKDILERGEQADIAARASDIARGGESAFGSRARLGAEERTRQLGRGLGEALGGLRSQGFQQAQQAAMGEYGRQQQALQQLGGGLAGLAGQRATGLRGLGQTLAGYGQTAQQALQQAGQAGLAGQQLLAGQLGQLGGLEQQIAQQRQQAQFGAGQAFAGLGQQAQQAAQADIQRQMGMGQMTQQQQQAQLDAMRRNALMQQQAPMQQMQSLLPFVQAVPAGFSQVATTFGVPPSALQTGLGVGLSALGGLGSFFNPPQTNYVFGGQQQQQP